MWYVNLQCEVIVDDAIPCFILTMWYVNSKLITFLSKSISSFILTMWYVNKEYLKNFPSHTMFYINYVVCKSIVTILISSITLSFYINYVVCKLELLTNVM